MRLIPFTGSSDDLSYAIIADEIRSGVYQPQPHPFYQRLAATAPVALIYSLFGVNLTTTVLWSLLASLILIATVHRLGTHLFGPLAGFLAALLLAANPLQIENSLSLNTDVILALFLFFSVILVRLGRGGSSSRWQKFQGVGLALCFTGGFLAKMSIVWFAPLIVAFMAYDLLKGRENLPFWQGFLLTGFVAASTYFLAYYLVTGDPLFRVNGIETLMDPSRYTGNKHMERLYGVFINNPDPSVLLERLTYGPLLFILADPGVSLLLILALPVLFHFGRFFPVLPPGTGYWALALFVFVFFFWFGSISISHYIPMSMQNRYLVPTLPLFALLAGVLLAVLFQADAIDRPGSRALAIGLTLVVVALIPLFRWLGNFKFQMMMLAVPFLLLMARTYLLPVAWRNQAGLRWIPMLTLVGAIMVVPAPLIHYSMVGSNPNQEAENRIVRQYLGTQTEPLVVYSDHRSVKTLPLLLGFPKDGRVLYRKWDDHSPLQTPTGEKGPRYLFVNSARLKGLHNSYGDTTPGFVTHPPANWRVIASEEGVTLYGLP